MSYSDKYYHSCSVDVIWNGENLLKETRKMAMSHDQNVARRHDVSFFNGYGVVAVAD